MQEESNDGDRGRVVRLEEHVAHAERTMEELSGEIAELHRRLRTLGERLARIEMRIHAMDAGEGDVGPGAGAVGEDE